MRFAWLLLVTTMLLGTAHAQPPKTRADFARALAAIKPGMAAADVERVLGKPDDIKTERDPGGITAARTVEVWRYGTRPGAHLSFATLGAVHIQADRKVQYVFGGKGAPHPAIVALGEATLRPLLDAIDAVPSYDARFDPRALIAATNALQPLGKDTALLVIDEYLRVSSWLDDPGREGVFLLLRALFDVNTGAPPPMMVGAPSPAPTNAAALPRFPLAIVGDVPLKLVSGYALGGQAEPPEQDVVAFRKAGTLRAAPLAPTAASLDAIAAYIDGPLAKALPVDDNTRAMLYDQALALFATAYRPLDATVDSYFASIPNTKPAARFANQRAAIAKLAPTWSPAHARFELANGAVLPPPPSGFQRVWWDIPIPNTTKVRATFERRDDKLVEVELRIELPQGGKIAADKVVIVDVATQKPIGEVAFDDLAAPATSTSGSVHGARLVLPRGRAIRLHTAGGIAGPVVTP